MTPKPPLPKSGFSTKLTDVLIKLLFAGGGGSALYFLYIDELPKAAIAASIAAAAALLSSFSDGLMNVLKHWFNQHGAKSGAAITQAIDNTVEKTLTRVTGFHQHYLDALKTHCHNLKVEGYKGRLPRLVLEDVYVPLRMHPGSHPQTPAQRRPLKIWDLLPKTNRPDNTFPERLLAIIANPGYGKTTLLRFLTLSFASHTHSDQGARDLIPILLLFREFYSRIQSPTQPTLSKLIVDQVQQLPRCTDLRTSEPWFKAQLNQGKCLVMFDGLDEVPESQRDTVSQWARWQMQHYPSQFILTSRPHGYDSSLFEGVQRIDILDFNNDQQRQFIDQWYRFITWEFTWKPHWQDSQDNADPRKRLSKAQAAAESATEAQNAADDLSRQLFADRNLTELARNPLLITIIAATHEVSEQLPTRRVHLYREIFKLLLEYRPNRRDTRLTIPTAEDNQQVLQYLATQLTRADRTQFPPAEGAEWIRSRLANLQLEPPPLPQQFLREMQQVSGLLVGGEGHLYEFTHKTFQEYLTAVELSARPWGLKQVMAQLANEAWREVVCFAAALTDPALFIETAIAVALETPDNPYLLELAQQLADDGKRIDDRLKQQLLEARQQQAPESAAVRLAQRFHNLTDLDAETAIDADCITWGEYQLFLEDQIADKFHSQADLIATSPGQAHQPVTDIPWKDTRWFCAWLATQNHLQPEQGTYYYRLPTAAEAQTVSAADNLTPFIDSPEQVGHALRVVRVQLSDRYTAMLNYLANGRWREADRETYEVMCQVIGKRGGSWHPKDIQTFPCEDLRILDQLWVQFSSGRFGFSVQRDIYVAVGGKLDGRYEEEAWLEFCDRVRWRVEGKYLTDDKMTFNPTGARGHLPFFLGFGFVCLVWSFVVSFLSHHALQTVTSKGADPS